MTSRAVQEFTRFSAPSRASAKAAGVVCAVLA